VNIYASDGLMLREKAIPAPIAQAAGNDRHLDTSLAQGESKVREQHTGGRVVWVKIAVEKDDTHGKRLCSPAGWSPARAESPFWIDSRVGLWVTSTERAETLVQGPRGGELTSGDCGAEQKGEVSQSLSGYFAVTFLPQHFQELTSGCREEFE
jgi:hypothetical protein